MQKELNEVQTVLGGLYVCHENLKDDMSCFDGYCLLPVECLHTFFILLWSQFLFVYSTTIASNLLVVDEIMKAGMSSLKSE